MLAFDAGIEWDIKKVEGASGFMSGGLFMLLGHWIGEKLADPAAQKRIHEFKEMVFFVAGFFAAGLIAFMLWRRRNVEKLHDVEEKVAEKAMAAEKKVVEKVVQAAEKVVPKKPAADEPPSPSCFQMR